MYVNDVDHLVFFVFFDFSRINANSLPFLILQRTNLGVWHSYAPPQLSGASEITGTVIEVLTGDTVAILPAGVTYDSESKLKKVSLASVRSPRVGNERLGKPDDKYALECKDRLRVLCSGKSVMAAIHYERDIPMGEVSKSIG